MQTSLELLLKWVNFKSSISALYALLAIDYVAFTIILRTILKPNIVSTAITDRTNHNKNFESFAKQSFQNFYWFGFWRKAL
ncbi:MAG: hypothetical protein DCF19_11605 [Pseudanabaena frigida]|uniref:Uncharacterized protein n=1 Tax=Pseudanabaena frigida TaxID=945775 RepID=A0A2W4W7X3_9CYAN|nr:MAG: hypothetical protein DCF19_11605 [Pseudanabaena frigida]